MVIQDPATIACCIILWLRGLSLLTLSGSEPNQDFACTPSHPSGRSAAANSQRQLLLIFRSPFLTLAFLICLLCRKSSFGFAPRAHWLDLSRSFSVHPFPPFIYRFATQNTRACTFTVWPRSLEIVTLGFAVASALDTYHDSFVLSHRRLASIQTSRFERIAPWRPQSLDCASCQVSSAVHVPNHPCPSTPRHWHQVHFSSSCKYPSLPVPAALLIVLALSWRAAITCTQSIALLTTSPSHFRHKPPIHHGCRATAPKATAY